jgi:hypothetical protein
MSYADPSLASARIEAGGLPMGNIPADDTFRPDHIQHLSDGRWLCMVHSVQGESLLVGTAHSKDGAIRAARNFIKRNQSAVYGEA